MIKSGNGYPPRLLSECFCGFESHLDHKNGLTVLPGVINMIADRRPGDDIDGALVRLSDLFSIIRVFWLIKEVRAASF